MKLSEENKEKLEIYCEMTGKDPEDVVNESVKRTLLYCVSSTKRPLKAILIETDGSEELCYILEKTTVFGKPYYRIMADGRVMSVPEKNIKEIES